MTKTTLCTKASMLSFNKQRGILLAPFVGFTIQTDPWGFEETMQMGLPLVGNLSFNLLIILYEFQEYID